MINTLPKQLKILYQIPSLETVYAAKFIYEGYRDAFLDLGHKFRPLTSTDNCKKVFDNYKPDIFISSLSGYAHKFIDLNFIKEYRKKGLVMFTQIYTWKKANKQYGGGDLRSDKKLVSLIKNGLAGDIFFSWVEQEDPLMDGFTKNTGYKFQTILMAANKKVYYPDFDEKYKAEISYVGHFLPDKREFIKKHIFPLMKKYDARVYGNDWGFIDRALGHVQKIGQYFNIDPLKKVRRVALSEAEGRKVFTSSMISLNIHENHQRKFGSDFNERTFKIIASGGFEICDNVKVLRKYFTDKELMIGENTKDWFDKIDYYLKYSDKRLPIIEAGRKKILEKHTYHNRAKQFIDLYEKFNRGIYK